MVMVLRCRRTDFCTVCHTRDVLLDSVEVQGRESSAGGFRLLLCMLSGGMVPYMPTFWFYFLLLFSNGWSVYVGRDLGVNLVYLFLFSRLKLKSSYQLTDESSVPNIHG